jgi:Uma2 family endonuclease
MSVPQLASKYSFEDYLAFEEQQPEKHEYLRGETFAMAGARQSHVIVSLNLAAAFRNHLRGTACRAYMADMLLRLDEAEAGFYPDVMVSCDSRDHAADRYLRRPRLIIEVLSDSTAAWDRGGKFAEYRKSASLEEYAVVDIEARRIECFRRTPDNHWILYEFSNGEDCRFDSIGLTLPAAVVFEDVEDTTLEPNAAGE